MTTEFPATCPTCGYRMDAHSAIGDHDAVPKDGDFSICIACGSPAIYTWLEGLGILALRQPTASENVEAMRDDRIIAAMLAHRQARASKPDWPRGPKET